MAIMTAKNSFLQRLIGAAALDAAVYEDVEADQSATVQAFIVVLLSSVAGGLGLQGLTGGSVNLAFLTMASLLAWGAWALVTYAVGGLLMPEPQTRVDVGELLRTIGFATTPGLLRGLGIIAPLAKPVFAATSIWMLLAMIVGVRQALDYTGTGRAVAVCVIGWLLSLIVAVGLGLLFTPALS
jgi:hypothetical protein